MVVGAQEADRGGLSEVQWLPAKELERVPRELAFCQEMLVAAVAARRRPRVGSWCPLPGTKFWVHFGCFGSGLF